MKGYRLVFSFLIVVGLSACLWAADPPPLLTAQGTVEKVNANTLTVRPRGPDGKFGKSLVLKITGTSTVRTLTPRMQKSSVIMVQTDTKPKDLQPKQSIALVYTLVKDSPVLLTAVVQPPSAK
ncbi:MAG TPA: hypothetical protein VMG10_19610 [Gemmataceae bacterium]|nr:hypothetical protein [Gemmataceae bacterium]